MRFVADCWWRRPGLDPRPGHVGFVVEKVALEDFFFLVFRGFPCRYNSNNTPHWSSSTCCFYRKDKWAKPGNLPKGNALSEIREIWGEKYVRVLPTFCNIQGTHLLYKLNKGNSVNTMSSKRLQNYTVYNFWYSFQSTFQVGSGLLLHWILKIHLIYNVIFPHIRDL